MPLMRNFIFHFVFLADWGNSVVLGGNIEAAAPSLFFLFFALQVVFSINKIYCL